MSSELRIEPDAPVIWYHVPRGGYGLGSRVLGQVIRRTAKRVRIRVWRTINGGPMERTVRPESLRAPYDRELRLCNYYIARMTRMS